MKEDAYLNILPISVTRDTSHSLRRVLNALAPSNILGILFTLDTSQVYNKPLKLDALRNIDPILVTDEVSQLIKLPLNEVWYSNAKSMFNTALTSQFDIGPCGFCSQFPYTGSTSKHVVMALKKVLSARGAYGGGLSAGGGDGGTYMHFPGQEPSIG